MPVLFTTEGSPGHRRLALWQDIVCDVYVGLDCTSDLGSAFRGSVTHTTLGRAVCSEVASDRQRVHRTSQRIARADADYVLVALGREGIGGVTQDGRDTVIRSGEFAIYDTTRTYELQFDAAFRQTVFKLPREMLQRRIGATEAVTAITFGADSPLQPLAYDFIIKLCERADHIGTEHAERLADQAADLVAMTLAERLRTQPLPASSHRAALLYRIKAHVRTRLSDSDLSLPEVARELGLSPRYVNDLFSDEQLSFQRFLLAERLKQCHRDLATPALAPRQISEIAFSWGFNDLSHFGRVFREQFGMTPREWRRSAVTR
ncbi:putative Transcriptional regulatory protein, AraC/XylS family (modular protein) [Bradyrhizobium sp. ORS 285]|uniref:AraC-like ligand-binding domain-containing protein n=1 Tax=Bradyrhizobium sp. ORS 285 TaxID=115808 RepID=UPI000240564C|nr:helix-turn-helix domain-containing protein [Bradyrhizobium sp. ORS 285]CCD85928.1 putative Transcriptional regulatory protein, AraC/XylS family (modular protein) [Bradyrhizobium sp. ORS 285]SMX59195.1 putative Transcriptional regulatory protein, AraC/XylS family (modular protein) [Bradyrhizobium sp. ORS 285]